MKEKLDQWGILLPFFVPYGFLVLLFDSKGGTGISTFLGMGLVMVLLGLLIRKSYDTRALIFGHGISLGLSAACIALFGDDRWDILFKPLTPLGLVFLVQGYCLLLQYVLFQWGRERNTQQTYFMSLSITVLVVVTAAFLLLYAKAARFGAI